jgi:hypothetical protein
MKFHTLLNSRNAAAFQATQKSAQPRSSHTKHAAHRYERRKFREYLRHGVDSEEASLRFERFG